MNDLSERLLLTAEFGQVVGRLRSFRRLNPPHSIALIDNPLPTRHPLSSGFVVIVASRKLLPRHADPFSS
ncbi:hypothetical protein [Phenylobacterium sp.]|uniref:hypothetical protein n=1 Tax=Phenylobacterium sp. TaxID=1871053 RepID=UPI0027338AC2|nr:hypothetical protein [Phenylobacterium sp.]MDP3854502.1 hypothetical protein [Phenylobacterium sp.]